MRASDTTTKGLVNDQKFYHRPPFKITLLVVAILAGVCSYLSYHFGWGMIPMITSGGIGAFLLITEVALFCIKPPEIKSEVKSQINSEFRSQNSELRKGAEINSEDRSQDSEVERIGLPSSALSPRMDVRGLPSAPPPALEPPPLVMPAVVKSIGASTSSAVLPPSPPVAPEVVPSRDKRRVGTLSHSRLLREASERGSVPIQARPSEQPVVPQAPPATSSPSTANEKSPVPPPSQRRSFAPEPLALLPSTAPLGPAHPSSSGMTSASGQAAQSSRAPSTPASFIPPLAIPASKSRSSFNSVEEARRRLEELVAMPGCQAKELIDILEQYPELVKDKELVQDKMGKYGSVLHFLFLETEGDIRSSKMKALFETFLFENREGRVIRNARGKTLLEVVIMSNRLEGLIGQSGVSLKMELVGLLSKPAIEPPEERVLPPNDLGEALVKFFALISTPGCNAYELLDILVAYPQLASEAISDEYGSVLHFLFLRTKGEIKSPKMRELFDTLLKSNSKALKATDSDKRTLLHAVAGSDRLKDFYGDPKATATLRAELVQLILTQGGRGNINDKDEVAITFPEKQHFSKTATKYIPLEGLGRIRSELLKFPNVTYTIKPVEAVVKFQTIDDLNIARRVYGLEEDDDPDLDIAGRSVTLPAHFTVAKTPERHVLTKSEESILRAQGLKGTYTIKIIEKVLLSNREDAYLEPEVTKHFPNETALLKAARVPNNYRVIELLCENGAQNTEEDIDGYLFFHQLLMNHHVKGKKVYDDDEKALREFLQKMVENGVGDLLVGIPFPFASKKNKTKPMFCLEFVDQGSFSSTFKYEFNKLLSQAVAVTLTFVGPNILGGHPSA